MLVTAWIIRPARSPVPGRGRCPPWPPSHVFPGARPNMGAKSCQNMTKREKSGQAADELVSADSAQRRKPVRKRSVLVWFCRPFRLACRRFATEKRKSVRFRSVFPEPSRSAPEDAYLSDAGGSCRAAAGLAPCRRGMSDVQLTGDQRTRWMRRGAAGLAVQPYRTFNVTGPRPTFSNGPAVGWVLPRFLPR